MAYNIGLLLFCIRLPLFTTYMSAVYWAPVFFSLFVVIWLSNALSHILALPNKSIFIFIW